MSRANFVHKMPWSGISIQKMFCWFLASYSNVFWQGECGNSISEFFFHRALQNPSIFRFPPYFPMECCDACMEDLREFQRDFKYIPYITIRGILLILWMPKIDS